MGETGARTRYFARYKAVRCARGQTFDAPRVHARCVFHAFIRFRERRRVARARYFDAGKLCIARADKRLMHSEVTDCYSFGFFAFALARLFPNTASVSFLNSVYASNLDSGLSASARDA